MVFIFVLYCGESMVKVHSGFCGQSRRVSQLYYHIFTFFFSFVVEMEHINCFVCVELQACRGRAIHFLHFSRVQWEHLQISSHKFKVSTIHYIML